MSWFSGKHFDRVNDVREIGGKDAQLFALEDGATALATKHRLAFNWTRPDGTPSRYASDDAQRAECIDELTKRWEDDRQYL